MESPYPDWRHRREAKDPLLGSRGLLAIGYDVPLRMGHFLKTCHPGRGNPQGLRGREYGELGREGV